MLSCCCQKWKSGLDEPSGDTQRHQSIAGPLPMPHHSSKPWQAAELPPCCSSAPHTKSRIPSSVLSFQHVSTTTIGPYLLCLLPVSSHTAPIVHKRWASLLLLPIVPQAAGQCQPKLFICWALLTASAPALPSHMLTLIAALLHNKVASRIFETMDPVVNGSLDNAREISCHALRCDVAPCMLCTHRSAA